MEAWDDVVGDVLEDDPGNERLRETIEDHFVNQLRSHSKNFDIDLPSVARTKQVDCSDLGQICPGVSHCYYIIY